MKSYFLVQKLYITTSSSHKLAVTAGSKITGNDSLEVHVTPRIQNLLV
jgi:hypothetical protein